MAAKKISKALLVTTAHRGVFFGYGDGNVSVLDGGKTSIRLTRARNCVYWPDDIRGFLGLATTGPIKGSRVGPAVDSIELLDITSVSAVSVEAVEKWEKALWS